MKAELAEALAEMIGVTKSPISMRSPDERKRHRGVFIYRQSRISLCSCELPAAIALHAASTALLTLAAARNRAVG